MCTKNNQRYTKFTAVRLPILFYPNFKRSLNETNIITYEFRNSIEKLKRIKSSMNTKKSLHNVFETETFHHNILFQSKNVDAKWCVSAVRITTAKTKQCPKLGN